ncbi:hypothetical protein [Profundibacterium mesophilum]|uniref:Uncharacterized protein n=1 Tax=Profundibacterium mesophilum KAUST100406-0324 TaxID=1037889 RepID=A0A921NV41_9RHOB|nr:hypothetical protein [Profundibacterium mesophilum]KAF0675354.1 hypothetical protein PMES_02244 [Profundibacterium mesophilum KAUST100406-0324]
MKKTPRWMKSVLDEASKPQPNLPWARSAGRVPPAATIVPRLQTAPLRAGSA